ncbi:MAG: hypothetical protein AB1758_01505 [Candidatus Eremiobacterota bacterium]
MNHLKDELADVPVPGQGPPLKKVSYKTPVRILQAASVAAFNLALVTLCFSLAYQFFLAQVPFPLGQMLVRSVPWVGLAFLAGAVIGAVEFAFFRKGRRE